MTEYTQFTVKAMKPDGSQVEFIVQSGTGTLMLPNGTKHAEAFQAGTELYNCLSEPARVRMLEP